jgi:thioredoxin reductase (NADPH)
MSDVLDCLVIGGGPAGLTAAIYLGRFRRRVLVVDKGWSRAEWITKSHNLPGFPEGVAGPVLLGNLRAQARHYGAVIETGVVDALLCDDEGVFTAKAGPSILTARTVILATGVIENKPPVAHVADAVKRGLIRTCPICDGYEIIGKHVAVLGNGEHAAREALFLRTYTDKLSLLLMATEMTELSQDTQRSLQSAGIGVTHVVIGSVSLGGNGVTVLYVEDTQTHRFDAIYSAFGTISQTMLATGLGARMDSSNRLFVDEHQATSVDGLFAAGDLVRGLNQISVAEGEAATASTAIHNRLPKIFA